MIPTSPSLAGSQEVPEFPDVTLTLTLDSRETWPTTVGVLVLAPPSGPQFMTSSTDQACHSGTYYRMWVP